MKASRFKSPPRFAKFLLRFLTRSGTRQYFLGEVGIRDFYQPLIELLHDENFKVRKEALISAGKLKNPKLWELVVGNLTKPELYSSAVSALISGGEATVPDLEKAFFK